MSDRKVIWSLSRSEIALENAVSDVQGRAIIGRYEKKELDAVFEDMTPGSEVRFHVGAEDEVVLHALSSSPYVVTIMVLRT